MIPLPIGRAEEDRLDFLENVHVPPRALRRRDVQVLLPCLVLTGVVVWAIWLLRR